MKYILTVHPPPDSLAGADSAQAPGSGVRTVNWGARHRLSFRHPPRLVVGFLSEVGFGCISGTSPLFWRGPIARSSRAGQTKPKARSATPHSSIRRSTAGPASGCTGGRGGHEQRGTGRFVLVQRRGPRRCRGGADGCIAVLRRGRLGLRGHRRWGRRRHPSSGLFSGGPRGRRVGPGMFEPPSPVLARPVVSRCACRCPGPAPTGGPLGGRSSRDRRGGAARVFVTTVTIDRGLLTRESRPACQDRKRDSRCRERNTRRKRIQGRTRRTSCPDFPETARTRRFTRCSQPRICARPGVPG